MPITSAYAAFDNHSALRPFEVTRRDPRAEDVTLEILYCGICHSDLHQVRNEWGNSSYPMVPGHEIVGRVVAVGAGVTKVKPGQIAGVGCMVDSCCRCGPCERGLEQYCEQGNTQTYNHVERDGKTPTYGGYSRLIVVDQRFVLTVADQGALEAVAPLLCAGITTYSPLRHWNVGKGSRVGVVGLGYWGPNLARNLAAIPGCELTWLCDASADARRKLERRVTVVLSMRTSFARIYARRAAVFQPAVR